MSPKSASRAPVRSSSEQRREQLIDAAVKEFAANGFHATSTAAIAKRAGISQPYVYALFPSKHDLFLAANTRVVERIRSAFTEAARGLENPADRMEAMGEAYVGFLDSRDEIMFQHQANAAAGDPTLREPVRREFMRLIDEVGRLSGASDQDVWSFMAKGMLLNVVAALDLRATYLPDDPESA